jgi:hypothetical protein
MYIVYEDPATNTRATHYASIRKTNSYTTQQFIFILQAIG